MHTSRNARPGPAIRKLRLLTAVLAAALVAACGGGDDNDAPHYHSVALAGDLVDYSIDTTRLTYSYTITESQFGLTGTTNSGTLTRNGDGSYSPSGAPESRLIVLPNGILFGAVRERFGTDLVTVPIMGVKDPVSTTAALAADYNYVQRSCAGATCPVTHGTLRIGAAGTWNTCRDGNVAAANCAGTASNGTLEARSPGLWRMKGADGVEIGTVIGYTSSGHNVLVVDLTDKRAGGVGVGMMLGGQQSATTQAMSDGTWVAATGSGHWLLFTAAGSVITVTDADGQAVNLVTNITANDPWAGMATTGWGDIGFISGSGVYMLETIGGDSEIGVRLP